MCVSDVTLGGPVCSVTSVHAADSRRSIVLERWESKARHAGVHGAVQVSSRSRGASISA